MPGPRRPGPTDPSIRRTWWLLAGAFLFLGLLALLRVAVERQPLDWLLAIGVVVAAVAAIGHRNAVAGLEARRRSEAESYASILRGLSRSVSAESIVGAIIDDLVTATGADHVAMVRRRADGTALDATLVTRRPGIPSTTTALPITDLEGPFGPAPQPVAIAIESDAFRGAADELGGSTADSAPAAVSLGGHRVGAPHPDVSGGSGSRRGVAASSAGSSATTAATSVPPATSVTSTTARPTAPSWLADPPGGLPRASVAWAQAHARHLAGRALTESIALLRDLGAPIPTRARDRLLAPVAETLGTGLDVAVTERIAARVRASFGLSQTLAVPIRTGQGLIGAIVLSRRDREAWPDSARRLLFGAARETATALERANSLREAEAQASTDALTGLPNRRYFDEFCGLLARRRRAGDAVAALMIDIDHFKRLNETYGHPVGDVVLRRVAGAIAATVRDEDVPARVGGEEFAVLLRNPGPSVAVEVGERVRRAVRSLDLSDAGVGMVSVSVGVANATGADEPIPDLVERADQALRKAKRAGRDRVIAAS
ncbi:MAG TPA: GGDEF domain-containing protein [Candidatus Limnocylindrales bacterium]|nr:GGDEF domain-containing protein [Candidatus Limnocylindrales bacterium]